MSYKRGDKVLLPGVVTGSNENGVGVTLECGIWVLVPESSIDVETVPLTPPRME